MTSMRQETVRFTEQAALQRYLAVRAQTERLAEPLSAEDSALQSMPDASPTKWHLGHTSWFFETFVLEQALPDFAPYRAEFRVLFNSYYVGIGPRHPRHERGLLSRPSLDEVLAFRRSVDERMEMLFRRHPAAAQHVADLVELGIHHEQQHQELILTDLKHLLSRNPLLPAYRTEAAAPAKERQSLQMAWRPFPEGIRQIGHDGRGFAFDNEQPRHRQFLTAFEISDRLVTNLEFEQFVEDGGYARPELWLSEGWDAGVARDWSAPLYWHDGEMFTLGGMLARNASEPVAHLSYYEADAYARWAGVRLPTEAEWETAARDAPTSGHFLESGHLHPMPGTGQYFGDTWEWTSSAYAPYPGFRPAEGAVGEYNGKFMVNQHVLRGGSCVTPASHIRASYRNFFPASARWQFTGIRLARDAR
jgi:ergothioneine biosynthesis protein EgtB